MRVESGDLKAVVAAIVESDLPIDVSAAIFRAYRARHVETCPARGCHRLFAPCDTESVLVGPVAEGGSKPPADKLG